jgi:phosphoribosylformimino-5-aminoimidazole carboxamide ribotide isomerase
LELYPALDIHAGRVVRASRATLHGAVVYHEDPVALAEEWAAAGARWLHVVDLDRAFGLGDQTALLGALVKRLRIPVQVGGGLWTAEDVERMRDLGVQRVLLGSRAAAFTTLLAAIADQFSPDSLGLALDVEGGRVWARDWSDAPRWTPAELAWKARTAGIGTMAYTELSREGALQGPAVESASAIAREVNLDVIVSGGVGALGDLARIRDAGLAGAIVGRALHENRFSLEDALKCCSSSW